MHKRILLCLCLLLYLWNAAAATASEQSESTTTALQDGTPVRLRLAETISSAGVKTGDPVSFLVVDDVKVNGYRVIPRGSVAMGTVVGAKRKHRLGRGGKLSIRIDFAWQPDGNKIPLRATKRASGGNHTRLMTGAMIGTSIVFLPATPVFAMMRGQECFLLKGTEITAYVEGDQAIELAKAVQKPAVPTGPLTADAALDEIVSLLPTRVIDAQGNEGDMVNVIIVASQEQLEEAFERAEWIQADRTKREAAVHLIEERRSYRELPMSKLYLFGRPQDYGYAIAETMISRRHHLRIWKTDYAINGSPVWAGAGTHDIGLAKNARSLSVTHKIDPNVDDERDFIASTLIQSHLVKRVVYATPADTITGAYTATGGLYHSDGKMLVLDMQ